MTHIENTIVLQSKSGKNYILSIGAAMMSETVKALSGFPEDPHELENWYVPEEPIPLDVADKDLDNIIQYCNYYHNNKNTSVASQAEFNKSFVDVDDDTLFSLILAANYLDIKSLLNLTCEAAADQIRKCNTPQEIRRRFGIKNDFTPEEEEAIKKENIWCGTY